MPHILAVIGATGAQGGSVVKSVLADAELSKTYTVRALTRDSNSDQAKELGKSVEVVQADVNDRASLEAAFTGVHAVFAMTAPHFGPEGSGVETDQGKNIADAAVAKGVQYLIFSTLPSIAEISGGKYTAAGHFEAKVAAEKYMRTLPIKSIFFSPSFFMRNFIRNGPPYFGPHKDSDGTQTITLVYDPNHKCPMIDADRDTGTFICTILAEPDKYAGKTFAGVTGFWSMAEVANLMSKASGKQVKYKQISKEEYANSLPFRKELMMSAVGFMEDYDYWGPDSNALVKWSHEQVQGKLITLEEFFEQNPVHLD